MLTQEQTETVKKRLIEQIEATFPEDRKQFAISQIEAMSSEELEKFLIKNNLLSSESKSQDQCVFCSIVFGDIKSYKIAENKKAIAVLEINPMSKGHAMIIPKEHLSSEKELPKEAINLSKKVSSLIKTKLKPREIKTEYANILGHEIINIIPFYEGKDSTERKRASPEELIELQRTLKKKDIIRKAPVKRKSARKIIKDFEEKLWLPKRIP